MTFTATASLSMLTHISALTAEHRHGDTPGHSHGLVDDSIKRSREGVRAVALALGVLGLAITLVILRISAQSWATVRGHHHPHQH